MSDFLNSIDGSKTGSLPYLSDFLGNHELKFVTAYWFKSQDPLKRGENFFNVEWEVVKSSLPDLMPGTRVLQSTKQSNPVAEQLIANIFEAVTGTSLKTNFPDPATRSSALNAFYPQGKPGAHQAAGISVVTTVTPGKSKAGKDFGKISHSPKPKTSA